MFANLLLTKRYAGKAARRILARFLRGLAPLSADWRKKVTVIVLGICFSAPLFFPQRSASLPQSPFLRFPLARDNRTAALRGGTADEE